MESITSDDILGKTAVDPHGSLLGTVVKLHIDNKKKTITGITVDQGFMKPDLFIGIDHVRHFGVDAVLLSSIPYNQLKGKKAISISGVFLGVVSRVIVKDDKLDSLIIMRKNGAFKKEEFSIDAKAIKEIGETIILRKDAE